MRRDLQILREVFSSIGEKSPLDSGLFEERLKTDAFWEELSILLLNNISEVTEFEELLISYKIPGARNYSELLPRLKSQYVSYLAADFIGGESNSTIGGLYANYELLLEEIAFQRNLKAAVISTERKRIRNKLSLIDEELASDITDSEIRSAFRLLEENNNKNEINLEGANKNAIPLPTEHFRIDSPASRPYLKRLKTIPLLFLKFAAAACVSTVGIWGGYKIYKANSHGQHKNAHKIDSMVRVQVNPSIVTDSSIASVPALPKKVDQNSFVKGRVLDKQTHSPIVDVLIKMIDEKGKITSYQSPNGSFNLQLIPNHTYYITAFKNGYFSDKSNYKKVEVSGKNRKGAKAITLILEKVIGIYQPKNDSPNHSNIPK